MPLIHCPECGTEVSDQAEACSKCAYPISKLNYKQATKETKSTEQTTSTNGLDLSGLDDNYKEEFTKIYESKEEYKGKWNWYSFFFSWMWLFAKGCWAWAMIMLGIMLYLTFSRFRMLGLGGSELTFLLSIGFAIFLGNKGTWMYYNLKIKNKQFPNNY